MKKRNQKDDKVQCKALTRYGIRCENFASVCGYCMNHFSRIYKINRKTKRNVCRKNEQ